MVYIAVMFERCLYFNANHLSRVVGKIWKDAFDEVGLAPAHAYLLRLILQKPGMFQREIADELYLEKSTITRFVDKMIDEGYVVRRTSDTGNKKEQRIYPTERAKEIEDRLNRIGDELYARMQSTVTHDELRHLVHLIRTTAQRL
ncbi:MAG: MarR family winged helix-turn-helix transcriptional regulator [Gammaproteobacteria bacterium]